MKAQDAAAEALRARIDDLYAATQRYNREQTAADKLLASGAINAREHAAYLALERKSLDEATEAVKRNGGAHVVSARQRRSGLINLGRQGADVFTTASMGMDPGLIAIQQGPQVLDALATSGIRVGAAMGIAAGAVAAVGAGVAIIGGNVARNEKDIRSFTASVIANADGAHYNAQELADLSRQIDIAGASTDEARMAVNAFMAEGVRPERLDEFADAAKYSAEALGGMSQAAAIVSKAFTGTFQEVARLDDQINFLTDSERKHIKALFDSGRAAEGRNAAFELFTDRYAKAYNESVTTADKLTRNLGGAWDNLVQSMSNTKPIQDATDFIGDQVDALSNWLAKYNEVKSLSDEGLDAERRRLEERLNAPDAEGRYINESQTGGIRRLGMGPLSWMFGPKVKSPEELRQADVDRWLEIVQKQNDQNTKASGDTTFNPALGGTGTKDRSGKSSISEAERLLESLMMREERLALEYQENVKHLNDLLKAQPARRKAIEEALAELKIRYDQEVSGIYRAVDHRSHVPADEKVDALPTLGAYRDKVIEPLKDDLKELPELIQPVTDSFYAMSEMIGESFARAGGDVERFFDLLEWEAQRALATLVGKGITQGVDWLIGAVTGKGPGGSTPSTDFFDMDKLISMDGGGYTGNGPRSGGLDGKGGFWAIMHPQETVIDHTRGQALPPSGVDIDAIAAVLARSLGMHMESVAVSAARGAYSRVQRNMDLGRMQGGSSWRVG